MITRSAALIALTTLAFAPAAMAASDLDVEVSSTSSDYVYDVVAYKVKVKNIGNQHAQNITVDIQLPETNTTTVQVMGTLTYLDSRCVQSGTTLSCSLGKVKKNKQKTVDFDIMLPQVDGPLEVSAVAATTSSENNLTNNSDAHVASLLNYSIPILTTSPISNSHCTGTNLTSFFECELYPSSISGHAATLHIDGTLTFPYQPDYDGTWYQGNDDELHMTYTYQGNIVAEFDGYGVDGNCFEGITTFPGSAYVSPYEVCL